MQKIQARYLEPAIRRDLKRKMVWIAGPRQVGKTTLMENIGKNLGGAEYFNWDDFEGKERILRQSFGEHTSLLLFDELHKYPRWKNYLKGLYDTKKATYSFLVSGSARMEIYRRGGDSLLGRYYRYRLHPFSLAELVGEERIKQVPGEAIHIGKENTKIQAAWKALLLYGGFPEPLLSQDMAILRRFQRQRADRVVRDDIRDLEPVRDVGKIELLTALLPERVGSLLSLNALREDLSVAHGTIAHWMDILESFFIHYRIRPYASTAVRSLRKEPKLYLWDWSIVPDAGARLENAVASHLLKFTHMLQDEQGIDADLHFLRDVDGREVDFLVTHDKKPWFAVEVKSGSTRPDPNILYFRDRLRIPHCYQLTTEKNMARVENDVHIVSAEQFLAGLV